MDDVTKGWRSVCAGSQVEVGAAAVSLLVYSSESTDAERNTGPVSDSGGDICQQRLL